MRTAAIDAKLGASLSSPERSICIGPPQPIPHVSLDEFTVWVLTQDRKYEYYKGEVFDVYAMAGAKADHNRVAGNVFAALHSLLKGNPCEPFIADMMVRVESDNVGYYPDVMVTCSPEDLARQSFKTDPLLIVEVLSPSSAAAYNRGKQFASYRLIPTLQHVVFNDPEACSMDHFQREGDRWVLLPSGAGSISFVEIDCQIAAVDIFAGINAAAQPSDATFRHANA